jgi:hypothetical protein
VPQTPSPDSSLREHLVSLLRANNAHVMFDDVIEDFPPGVRGVKPQGLPYTAWQIVEHLRIALWDILEFSRNAKHVSPDFPGAYWPDTDSPPDDEAWDRSVAAFRQDLQRIEDLVRDPAVDLYAPIPHGDGQTVLREAMLVADHNAYHVGQLVLIRRLLDAWPSEERVVV